MRADTAYSRAVDTFSSAAGTPFKASAAASGTAGASAYKIGNVQTDLALPGASYDVGTGAIKNLVSLNKNAQNTYGWETRGRVDIESRTPTAYGTVQTVASLRLSRANGTLNSAVETAAAPSASNTGSTLEAAYVRFAGFTFGAAKDNFAFMPSTFYGSGHWASFANGAKQIAYTAVLGGGFSATLAIQDANDTTAGGVVAAGYASSANGGYTVPTNLATTGDAYNFNKMPQINARIDFDQSWGTVSAVGALGQAVGNQAAGLGYNLGTATSVTNSGATLGQVGATKATYALGAGVKLNVPQLAAGDALYLNGGYANGMTEYTTNWTSFKSSDTKQNVGGFVLNHPSWLIVSDANNGASIETLKSWNIAALFTHYWAPQWRHSVMGTYGAISGTTTSKALAYGNAGAFGDAKVWNAGTQLAFLPTKDFEIGVDVLYARVTQDIRRTGVDTSGTSGAAVKFDGSAPTKVTREAAGNWTGRLRVERTF